MQATRIIQIEKQKTKRRGRKKLGTEEKGNHDKKTFDNRIRRVKNSLLNESRILLNGKIKSVYHFKKIPRDWELFKINSQYWKDVGNFWN